MNFKFRRPEIFPDGVEQGIPHREDKESHVSKGAQDPDKAG